MAQARTIAKRIKYGYSRGPRLMVGFPMAASQTFEARSGKYVYLDSNNDMALLTSGIAHVFGWCDTGPVTTSSTAGYDWLPIDVSVLSAYWIPADATVTEAMRGDTCDVVVSGDTQQADVGSSSDDIFLILDVDPDNQAVLVKIADGKQQANGIA